MEIKTKVVSCHTPYSKPVKQEVNGTVILPSLVFPASFDEQLIDWQVLFHNKSTKCQLAEWFLTKRHEAIFDMLPFRTLQNRGSVL